MSFRFLSFPESNRRALLFGFVHSFCSSPGQTYCIALFVASFAAAFQSSAAELGTVYFVATLGSALTLTQIGPWIDVMGLRTYSIAATLLLASACVLTALAPNLVVLTAAIYLLRLSGQGLMIHIQTTATVRAFTRDRGTALGITSLGAPAGGAVYPPLAALLIAGLDWRLAFAAIGTGTVLLLLAAIVWSTPASDPGNVPAGERTAGVLRGAARALLLRSPYFWAAAPMLVLVPFVATALTFHLTVIADARGWSQAWIAVALPLLALAQVVSLFISGRLIDRYSAQRVAVFHGIPITCSVLLLAAFDHPAALLAAMLGLGMSGGASQTAFAAVWAEVFGAQHFGAIRSIVMSLSVLASASAPLALGVALSAMQVSLALFAMAALAVALQVPLIAFERCWPRTPPPGAGP